MFLAYHTAVYNNLNHFDEAKMLLPSLEAGVAVLGTIVEKHGLSKLVGAALLHKHFDLNSGEVLVERADGTMSEMAPREQSTTALLPYMWKYSSEGWYPLEFAEPNAMDAEKLQNLCSNVAFLAEIGEAIVRFQLEDKIGITIIHREHVSAIDGSTMELTDLESRKLTVLPASAVLPSEDHYSVKTVWKFGNDQGEDVCHHCGHCTHVK